MEDLDGLWVRLKGLDLRGLLSYWILNERNKARLYSVLAQKVRDLGLDDSVYDVFRLLSLEASRHDRKLMSLYERVFGTDELLEVALPSLSSLSLTKDFNGGRDVFKVLEAALKLEILAEDVYGILTEAASDDYMRAVFSYLGSTERLHRRTIEGLMREYGCGHA